MRRKLLVKKRASCNLDSHIQIEKENVLSNSYTNGVLNGYQTLPPDPITAVGSHSLVTMVNEAIAFFTKDTLEEIFVQTTNEFFNTSVQPSDVYCVYDEFSKRFFLSAFSFYFEDSLFKSYVFLAVSTDENPQGPEDFHKYVYLGENFTDFPKIAIDKEAVYLSTNDFQVGFPGFVVGNVITAFDKKPLVSGNAPEVITPVYREIFETNVNLESLTFLFPLQPRKTKDNVEKVLFIQGQANVADEEGNFAGNTLRVYQIKDVLTNGKAVWADVCVPEFRGFKLDVGTGVIDNTVPQPSPLIQSAILPIIPISASTGAFISGVVAGNSIWTNHCVYSDDGQDRTVARWYELDVSKFITKNKVKLVQAGNADTGGTSNQIYPSINVDACGNMAIQFTMVGLEQYPAIAYTGRLKNDPKGTVRFPVEIAQGGELYYQFGNPNRYGDYSGLAIDPCDHKTFWLFNQYPVAENPGTVRDVTVSAEGVGTFSALATSFSPTFTKIGAPGKIADPANGCTPIAPNSLTDTIGIIEYSPTDCADAGPIILNVEDAGAEATLIIDNKTPTTRFIGSPDQTKPAVSISSDDGALLLAAIESSQEPVIVSIDSAIVGPRTFGSNWSTYLAAFELCKNGDMRNAPQQKNILAKPCCKKASRKRGKLPKINT